jgi:hypothetical protein
VSISTPAPCMSVSSTRPDNKGRSSRPPAAEAERSTELNSAGLRSEVEDPTFW